MTRRPVRTFFALTLMLGLKVCSVPAGAQPERSETESAAQLFKAGQFSEAGKLYGVQVEKNPRDRPAILQLARIALLANRLEEARRWLESALALKPDDDDAKVMLAAVFFRLDAFQLAADALSGVEVSTNQLLTTQYPALNVAMLRSFRGQTPYEVLGRGESTRLPFVKTDPLPVVSVRVNGGEPVNFFIDTGASDVTLDTTFARELGVPSFGSVQGTFSGGQHAEVASGRIASLTTGDWTIRNLPIATLPLRQLSEGFGVKRIDGIIGTTLLSHFLPTLDYPQGELVLRRKSVGRPEPSVASSSGPPITIPFWMAGDHFMVAWGRVENLPPSLLFIDTGLAGAGAKLAESVLKEAAIPLQSSKATRGEGGGGTLNIVPYTIGQLSLGGVTETNVAGLFDGPFPWEHRFGFRLAGMVGHGFFRPYALTFDFQTMRMHLQRKP